MKLKWVGLLVLLASLSGCIVAPAPPPPAYTVTPGYYYYPRTYYYPGYVYPLPGVWWGYRGGHWHHR